MKNPTGQFWHTRWMIEIKCHQNCSISSYHLKDTTVFVEVVQSWKEKKKELCKQIEKLFLLAFLTYWPDQHIHSNTIKNSIKLIRKTIKIYIVQHKCGHITSRLPNYERGNQWKKITNYGNIPIVFNQYFPNYTMIYSSILTNIFSNISLL